MELDELLARGKYPPTTVEGRVRLSLVLVIHEEEAFCAERSEEGCFGALSVKERVKCEGVWRRKLIE